MKKLLSVPGRPTAVIPVFNIPREDFCLRTEAVFLFKRFHLDCSYITFVEDVDLQNLLETKRLQLVLVDHNILAQRQKHMDVAVTEVLGRCTIHVHICIFLALMNSYNQEVSRMLCY